MVIVDQTMRRAATAILVLSAGVLAGCATPSTHAVEAEGDYPDLSLAESKSNVQLLRNAAESRIAAEVIESSTETDFSAACLSATEDPDGEIRRWVSTTEVNLVRWHAWRVDDVANILIDTFVSQSWNTIDVEGEHTEAATLLTSGKGLAEIRIEAVGTEDDSTATLFATVSGPCVKTDGTGSDEVADLER